MTSLFSNVLLRNGFPLPAISVRFPAGVPEETPPSRGEKGLSYNPAP
jgi:hypothetical protein